MFNPGSCGWAICCTECVHSECCFHSIVQQDGVGNKSLNSKLCQHKPSWRQGWDYYERGAKRRGE